MYSEAMANECVCALGLAHNVHRIVFIMYIYISILFDEN